MRYPISNSHQNNHDRPKLQNFLATFSVTKWKEKQRQSWRVFERQSKGRTIISNIPYNTSSLLFKFHSLVYPWLRASGNYKPWEWCVFERQTARGVKYNKKKAQNTSQFLSQTSPGYPLLLYILLPLLNPSSSPLLPLSLPLLHHISPILPFLIFPYLVAWFVVRWSIKLSP